MKKINSQDARRLNGGNTASQNNSKRILIADDDQGIQDIFTIIFENAGYAIELKTNGDDILKNKFTLPHVFLIDKQLSGTDGLDICRYLKNQKLTKHIPVIMVSASPDIAKLSREAGADAYIEKPFEVKDLLRMVGYYTSLDENGMNGK
jgi:CheY-like chemotaxis protein